MIAESDPNGVFSRLVAPSTVVKISQISQARLRRGHLPGLQGPCRHWTPSQRSAQLRGHWLAQPRVNTVSWVSQLSPRVQ